MLDSFINWVNGLSQSLAATALLTLASLLLKKWNDSNAETRQRRVEQVSNAARRSTAKLIELATVFAIFWFLLTQLRPLITDSTPPSRTDVFLIVFWTFWLLIVFVRVITGPFATTRVHAPADTARHTPGISTLPPQDTPPTDHAEPDSNRPSTPGSGSA
ncbi:hypothetical protein [Delftia sp. PS-11]|uniref:hypothetical protein n=1 Tax=Delftia sp. PS-11 TaxID=2767222 RepID=UPI0024571510|nr:hypothetical protein [Delftia sp. PS-11]KAJ8745450.1 hypothetical protein H9T68_06530 [Delftia sp. PS-11]